MPDLALGLDRLLPGVAYGGSLAANTKEAYDALRWEDERPKPPLPSVAAAAREAEREIAWQELRSERNRRLDESDWAILSDSPRTQAERNQAKLYRRRLRDLPTTTSDPTKPSWPSRPDFLRQAD